MDTIYNDTIIEISSILESYKKHILFEINSSMINAYWRIGEILYNKIINNNLSLRIVSEQLKIDYGKRFSKSNIQRMIKFYTTYKTVPTLSGQLTWSHYCELLSISSEDKRMFYEKECINSNWSVRELKRQINTCLYERILLSKSEINKKAIIDLAHYGNEINSPEDLIKDPYVFEFLDIPEKNLLLESDFEKALIDKLKDFILELGKGFMFVGNQQRITIDNNHYYVDLVFYNKILKSYVLIELKTGKFMPSAVGQLNMYLNYYANEINDENDNSPIGIILCTEKDNIAVEYALGNLNSQIFASKYVMYIPKKEELIEQVENIINLKLKSS